MKQYHTAVIIGRFQIPHLGHEYLFKKASEIAENLVILVGSVGQPKTPKNPFSFDDRKNMIEPLLPKGTSYHILPVRDQKYNNNNWVVDVVNKVNSTLPKRWSDFPPKVAIVGHKKDNTSFYLDLFPQWKLIDVEHHKTINATQVRDNLFKFPSAGVSFVSEPVKEFLEKWKYTDEFRNLQEEWFFIEEYKDKWKNSPYTPIFTTVDAVVIQSGHILMIQRKEAPGLNQWALPGGFIEPNETLKDAVLRELIEETQIKLQRIILERNITKREVYDHPERSLRGRTITHAFRFELSPGELPRIRGGSDANKAKWIPLNEVYTMGEVIYEDHLDIILDMVK